MVERNSATTIQPPLRTLALVCVAWVVLFGIENEIRNAGKSQLMRDGKKRVKNWPKCTNPFCQIISVVMSPKGENAPPALAATTMLTHAPAVDFLSWPRAEMATAPMTSAVVRLSAT